MFETIRKFFTTLAKRHTFLTDKVLKIGGDACSREMLDFSRECARYVVDVSEAGLHEESESLRRWSFCWAVKAKVITGRVEFPVLYSIIKRKIHDNTFRELLRGVSSNIPDGQYALSSEICTPSLPVLYNPKLDWLTRQLRESSFLRVYIANTEDEKFVLHWKFLLDLRTSIPNNKSQFESIIRKFAEAQDLIDDMDITYSFSKNSCVCTSWKYKAINHIALENGHCLFSVNFCKNEISIEKDLKDINNNLQYKYEIDIGSLLSIELINDFASVDQVDMHDKFKSVIDSEFIYQEQRRFVKNPINMTLKASK